MANKSDFLIVITVFSVVITSVSAYNGYEVLNKEDIDYSSIYIPSSSSTHRCIQIISEYFCKGENPTVDDCAKGALLNWQKGLTTNLVEEFFTTQDLELVEEYFNTYDGSLIAREFLLPHQYCFYIADKYSPNLNVKIDNCIILLENFTASASTIRNIIYQSTSGPVRDISRIISQPVINVENEEINSIHVENEEINSILVKIRRDIQRYAFFETRLNNVGPKSTEHRYLRHIALYTLANSTLDTPRLFCLKKHTIFNEITGRWDIF